MDQERHIVFGPFRLDLTAGRLWREAQEIGIRARTRAVLCYLVAHTGRVIARAELEQHIWAETHVSKTTLRVCIWELRQALGDQAVNPQYIETVGQQGYRFVAETRDWHEDSPTAVSESAASPLLPAPFVGRQAELAYLQECLAQARRGVLQLVFVTGEAGVGKTMLVQQFLAQLPASRAIRVGRGQCIEQAGPGEAYLPLLEALGRLGREPGGEWLVATLRRVAPTWLVHLPMLVEASELDAVQRRVHGASRDRMLRELVEALIAVTTEAVLILVLEDLHWSDASTVEWLASLARRPERLRLLVLGTYRPAEVIARRHPLRQTVQELVAHRLCQELRLELLSMADVQEYVAHRLGARPATAALGAMLYRRTDGNALFMVHFLDYLLQHGLLVQDSGQWVLRGDAMTLEEQVPDNLQPLLMKQLEALGTDAQQFLAVASVAGARFTAAEVAAGVQRAVEDVEAVCDGLHQRGQFIAAQDVEAWPDGTLTARYEFRHALYHHMVYARLGSVQRVRLHQRLGECLEAGYGKRAHEIASVLAHHFEHGRDARRAVQYQRYAAEQALHRSAYPEALAYCQQGLAGLDTWPETPERAHQELALRLCLSTVLATTHGYAAPVLEQTLQRAQALCQTLEATAEAASILVRLTRLHMARADRAATEVLMVHEEHLLERLDDAAALVQLHTQLGTAETYRAAYARAQEHHRHALRLYDVASPRALALAFDGDPAAVALGMSGWRCWLSGWPVQAWDQAARALAQAETVAHPYTLCFALFYAAHVRQFRGEHDAAWALVQRLLSLGRAQGFGLHEVRGVLTQGCILVQRGELAPGVECLSTGLAQHRRLGNQLLLPFFLAGLADAALRRGQVADGLHTIAEALRLTATNFDCFWEAELYRLRGELLLAPAVPGSQAQGAGAAEAETCFHQALDIARRQEAKALELRAAMSLSRLWQAQGKHEAAYTLLGRAYGWFTEGFDTADIQAARRLLEALLAAR